MAFDATIADRVRRAFPPDVTPAEIKMMGALVFLVNGHMCCGVTGEDLMVRIGPDARDAALGEPHVRPMDIGGGRQPGGFVLVAPDGYSTDAALTGWVGRGLAFAASLPPKKPRK